MPAPAGRVEVGPRSVGPSGQGTRWSRSARRTGVAAVGVAHSRVAGPDRLAQPARRDPGLRADADDLAGVVEHDRAQVRAAFVHQPLQGRGRDLHPSAGQRVQQPARACGSVSSSASRSMVASTRGRGAGVFGVRGAGAAGQGVLAQGQQPVRHRSTVLAGHGTPARVELVERVLDRVTVGQVVGHGDGWTQRGVQRLGHGREPDRCRTRRTAPRHRTGSATAAGTAHVRRPARPAPTGTADAGRPSPRRPGTIASGSQSRWAIIASATSRSSSPRRPTGHASCGTADRGDLRPRQPPIGQPRQCRGHVGEHLDRPEDVPRFGVGAADLVLQPHVQTTCPPVTSARSSAGTGRHERADELAHQPVALLAQRGDMVELAPASATPAQPRTARPSPRPGAATGSRCGVPST